MRACMQAAQTAQALPSDNFSSSCRATANGVIACVTLLAACRQAMMWRALF
jgi:hypothetical protein